MPAHSSAASDAATSNDAGVSRRRLLLGGAAGLGAAGLGAVGGYALGPAPAPDAPVTPLETPSEVGSLTIPFHGRHQAGIELEPQAHSSMIAFDLTPSADRDGIRRMLRLITSDAERLTAGRPALADTEPELALTPARLTVTVAFGPDLVDRVDPVQRPDWLAPLPAFTIDQLEPRWSGGDLLLEVAADDPITIAHASRMLVKDIRRYAAVRWRQDGFRHAAGSVPHGSTQRNLFGQLDGTANPAFASESFARVVWRETSSPAWLRGGTSYVIRRIAMNLDTWDELDRGSREQAVGRRLDTGAPLSGVSEFDAPDLAARASNGLPVISPIAHVARARSGDGAPQIFRRGYNYDLTAQQGTDAGLIFGSLQADPVRQFVPIQQRLADVDLLNIWTTPIGSAVFAVPPGCAPGGYLGETLV
ncbi:MAG: Dyp-type peroxidase [Chryseoglobus sp.]|nr:Dyp-type peroxidase [Microcella sp.]MBX9472916.1 Dyp-type peroxidase [Microcella sp.]